MVFSKNGFQSVILHGGLGNQLFQWSYGHQLALLGEKVKFTFYKRPYVLEHTRTSLGEFLPNCEHASFVEIDLPRSLLGRVLLDPVHKRNIFSKVYGELLDSTDNPFFESDRKSHLKQGIHFGYFQSYKIVLNNQDTLLDELWRVLESRERNNLEKDIEGAEIIHVRQGDTLTPKNMKKVGVLSLDYYAQIPYRSERPRIVLTDDVDGANRVLSNLHIDAIFGPSELDVYQTLGVMARSTSLYTANSTLSWWGGFLAQSRGADIYIPNPFFRDFSPNPGLTFAYPAFNLFKSKFINM